MRTYQCNVCDFEIVESDKHWDEALKSGNCPRCKKNLKNVPHSVSDVVTTTNLPKKQLFKTFLLFSFAGPMIGVMPLIILAVYNPMFFLLFVGYAYLFGFIPAAIAGLVFNFLMSYVSNETTIKQQTGVGFLSGLFGSIPLLALFIFSSEFDWSKEGGMIVSIVLLCSITGAVCGYLNYKIINEKC